ERESRNPEGVTPSGLRGWCRGRSRGCAALHPWLLPVTPPGWQRRWASQTRPTRQGDPEPDGMKISILLTHVPFVWGGAEYLAETLRGRLRARGHQAELVRVPFKWYPPSAVLDHMLACRHLRLASGDPDLVIPMKFPVYLGSFP